jgi:hypothetical protein
MGVLMKFVPKFVPLAVSLLAFLPVASAQVCDDVSDECRTTMPDACADAIGNSVVVQIGGLGAEDNDDSGGTCGGTPATALFTFTKTAANQLQLKIENTTCDTATITAAFWNLTNTIISPFSLDSVVPLAPDVVDTVWNTGYSQTQATNDGFGFKAGGFGNFDANVHNGNLNPNGGNPIEILAGETLYFNLTYTGSYNLCDILTEISTPDPGERNRNAAGRFQACDSPTSNVFACKNGDNHGQVCVDDTDCPGGGACVRQDSAYIGPCTPDDDLLAAVRNFRLSPGGNAVGLEWETSLEISNAGFNVLRREARGAGGWVFVNPTFIPGAGDSVSGARYSFVDLTARDGVEYQYRLEDIDFSGKNGLHAIERTVPNPQDPDVRLRAPGYGEAVALEHGLRLGYDSVRIMHGTGLLQISSDPGFEASRTISARTPIQAGANEIKLNPRMLRQMQDLAADGVLYWRLAGSSDTFRMEVQ